MINFFNYSVILSSVKVSSSEETQNRACAYLANNSEANRNALVLAVSKLCLDIAKKYASTQEDAEDIYSEAILSLLENIDKYSEEKGSFTTFAANVASSAAYRYSLNKGVVRNPKAQKAYALINKVSQKHYAQYGSYPNEDLLLELVSGRVSANTLIEVLTPCLVSLDNTFEGSEGEVFSALENGDIAVKVASNFSDNFESIELSQDIHNRLSRLSDKEKAVICLAFGFNKAQVAYDFVAIGERIGLSDEGAKKIYKRALAKMK